MQGQGLSHRQSHILQVCRVLGFHTLQVHRVQGFHILQQADMVLVFHKLVADKVLVFHMGMVHVLLCFPCSQRVCWLRGHLFPYNHWCSFHTHPLIFNLVIVQRGLGFFNRLCSNLKYIKFKWQKLNQFECTIINLSLHIIFVSFYSCVDFYPSC